MPSIEDWIHGPLQIIQRLFGEFNTTDAIFKYPNAILSVCISPSSLLVGTWQGGFGYAAYMVAPWWLRYAMLYRRKQGDATYHGATYMV